ncbi:MAG: OsmC family protein [Thermoleophilia bacterium]
MKMDVYFPGGKRVYADYKDFTIETDQPVMAGGDDSAPAPFDLFLASIGTCAGIFVLSFMQERNIPTDDARISVDWEYDREKRLITKFVMDVHLPPDFPEQYRAAVVRAAELCTVKRHLHEPPEFEINTVIADRA